MGKITSDIERIVGRYLRNVEPVDLGLKGEVYIPSQDTKKFVVAVEHSPKYNLEQPFYSIYLYYMNRMGDGNSYLRMVPSAVNWGIRENVYWYIKDDVELCDLQKELKGLIAHLESINDFQITRGKYKHAWAATDSQGYCMECARCGTYINFEGRENEGGASNWDAEVDACCPVGFEDCEINVSQDRIVYPRTPKGDYSLKIKVIIENGIVQAVLKNQDVPAEVEIIDLDCDYDDYDKLSAYRKEILQNPDYINCSYRKSDFTEELPF